MAVAVSVLLAVGDTRRLHAPLRALGKAQAVEIPRLLHEAGFGVGAIVHLTRDAVALAGDPGLRSRMSADARTFYEREGTIARMAERYLSVITHA